MRRDSRALVGLLAVILTVVSLLALNLCQSVAIYRKLDHEKFKVAWLRSLEAENLRMMGINRQLSLLQGCTDDHE